MRLRACMWCLGLLLMVAESAGAADCARRGQVAVQGARPNEVLKPCLPKARNWRHALASPTAPQIPWKSEPNFLKLPAGMHFGETMGIARNSKGQMYVFTRLGDASRLFQFDQNGDVHARDRAKFLRLYDGAWRVCRRAGLRLDHRRGHQHRHQMESEYGEARNDPRPAARIARRARHRRLRRCRLRIRTPSIGPNDVVTDAQGNIFVADGYNNNRAIKYDKNGRFVASTIGTRGREPGQMHLPHSITADSAGNIYVGDRNNGRIQVFSNDLTLRTMYEHVGAPWAVCITPGPHQYLYSSNSNPDQNVAAVNAVTGEIFKMELDGTVVGKFGKAGQGAGRALDRARHRLQERERDSGRRNRGLARAEVHARCSRARRERRTPDER